MATRDEVLAESTKVANDIAQATGRGSFEQGVGVVPVNVMENPPTPVQLPQVEFDPSTARSAVEAAKGFSNVQEQNAAKAAEAEATQTQGVRDLMDFVSGKGAERVSSLEDAGIPKLNKELADLTSRIRLGTDRLAAFSDQTFLGEEAMRLDASKRDITKNTFSAIANERRLQRAIEQTEKASTLRTQIATAELMQNNITAATEQIDAALEAKYAPVEEALKNEMFFLQRQWQISDRADQRAFEAKMGVVQAQQQEISDAKEAVTTALQMGATPQEVMEMNRKDITPQEQLSIAQSIISRGATQMRNLEIQQKIASINASNRRQTQVVDINGVKTLIDSQTGERIAQITGDGSPQDAIATALASQNINNINSVINSPALSATVGPSALSRTNPGLFSATKRFFAGAIAGAGIGAAAGAPIGGIGAVPGAIIGALSMGVVNATRGSMSELSGNRQDFVATTEQIRENLTLEKLIQAKSNGATFGALSDGERAMLAASASKLGTWAVTDGAGNITGYNVSESAFKKEMDFINNMAKLDQILKGTDPASIGVIVQDDGSYWVSNSDGTLTRLR